MSNIQIFFFCVLTTILTISEIVLLWQYHRLKAKIKKTTEQYEENIEKMKSLCNKIYDKLKEVVDKVNPLLAQTNTTTNDNIQDAVFTEEN